jgi:2-oxoglutarate/2-oxoacid ferredoxin oxidoreductase subunit alpha
MVEVSVRVGGAAGDGIASVGEIIAHSFARLGLHVFGHNAYQSVIRGGHVWFQGRAANDRVYSQGDGCDVIYALNLETAEIHLPSLNQGGYIVYDPEKFSIPDEQIPVGTTAVKLPTLAIARKYTSQSILQNAAGLGAASYLSGLPLDLVQGALADSFGKKKGDIVEWNIGAAAEGHRLAREAAGREIPAITSVGPPKLLMTGNQAIAVGAAAAGCKFLAQYPMTPASTIMHWLAAHSREIGVVVKQAEDELAAINMAIGASFGGVRSMTATSGGGFALMVEALGMAGMSEIPLVVVESQRSGPSTGLPTKTEQGDLNLMLGAGQGEFPRAILAPSHPIEAYHATVRAFELAEEWQTPILLASDLHLSENFATVDRSEITFPGEVPLLFSVTPNGHDYRRYAYTPNGVSPRSLPGQPGLQYVSASDEHDDKAHLISDIKSGVPVWVAERVKMMTKRMHKLDGLRGATAPPHLEGAAGAELTFVTWGSTLGAVRDAVRLLATRSHTTNILVSPTVYPFHGPEFMALAAGSQRLLLVEANYSGQFGRLIRAETGFDVPHKLMKFDGEPFYPMEIVGKALEVITHGGK